MKSSHPNENIIRQYLLGKLNDQKELEEELSKQMFFDDDLSLMVDSIEDEILDEYLDGTLSPTDMQAVKEYFLCPQERKDKLQFARIIRTYFDQTPPEPTQAAPPSWGKIGTAPTVLLRSHARTYVEIAALFLLSVSSLLYISNVRRQLQSSSAENQKIMQRLEEERQRSASFEKQMQELLPVSLTLVNERSRDGSRNVFNYYGGVGGLAIKPSMRMIKIEIVLEQVGSQGSFDVALETQTGSTSLWSRADVPASARVLTFVMPSQGINAGSYSFAVKPHGKPGGNTEHYDFQVTVTK